MKNLPINEFFENVRLPEFLKGHFLKDNWFEIVGQLESILDEHIESSQILTSNDSMKTKGKVYIGEDCKIGENVVIHGPVYIANNVTLSPFSFIRPGSIILNNARVGTFGIVKSSLMFEGSSTSDYCYLGDSILGFEAMMGAHSSTLNQKFDKSDVFLNFKESKFETKLNKFGAIIGDKSRLGGGAFTTPGSMIGKRSYVYPGVVVEGFIPSDKFVTVKKEILIKDNKFSDKLKAS